MRNVALLILVLVAAFTASCGKNERINTLPPAGPMMAPPPQNYNGGYTPGGFQPAIPQGYGPQYYPFLPVDNYMRGQNPGYWNQYMNGYFTHCQQNQINPYNFNYFWYSYCPSQWYGTQMWTDIYVPFNSNVYYYSNSQYYWPNSNASYWQNWAGVDFNAWFY